jgi:hypothetical protein
MDNIIPATLDSPLKKGAASFVAVYLGYLAIKGVKYVFFGRRDSHIYPPGPPREFLIGTLRSFPMGLFVDGFCEWAKTYGMCHRR